MANRVSVGSAANDKNKRWSLPGLQPIEQGQPSPTGPTTPAAPARPALAQRSSRSSRGSVSGTSYGKTDFGVQIQPAPSAGKTPVSDKRASKRMSRMSKLSDVSEAESDRRSTQMSVSGPPDRRMSRKMSIADHLQANEEMRKARRQSSIVSQITGAERFTLMEKTFNWQQRPDEAPGRRREIPWEEDRKRPANWHPAKKTVNTLIAATIAFTYTLTIGMYAAASIKHVNDLGQPAVICVIPYACFILGLALGPILSTPFEIAYGRKPVCLCSIPLFAIVMIGAGTANEVIGLSVSRFLAATFASPSLFITHTIIQEIWVASRETKPIAAYVSTAILGLAAGPIVGGVICTYISWRWTEFISVFVAIAVLFGCINMGESQEAAIKRRRKTLYERNMEDAQLRQLNITKAPSRLLFKGNLMISHTFRMLKSPKLIAISMFLGYTSAMLTILPIFGPGTFMDVYTFNPRDSGLTFLAACFGVLLAYLALHFMDKWYLAPRLIKFAGTDENGEESGEKGTGHASWRKGLLPSAKDNSKKRQSDTADRNNSDASSVNGKRSSTGSNRKSRHMAFSERNINIAIAVTRFLNAQAANAERKIIVERVMVLLKNTESFTVICSSLHDLGLQFEDALLAKTITEALTKEKAADAPIALARSKSLHRLTAEAALMGPGSEGPSRNVSVSSSMPISPINSVTPVPPARNPNRQSKRLSIANINIINEPAPDASLPQPDPMSNAPAISARNSTAQLNLNVGPPPEWRLIPALGGSIIVPAGLFMFGWTARVTLSWIIPTLGLMLVTIGAVLNIFSTTAYLLDLHGEDACRDSLAARSAALLVTSILSAAFPIIVVPMTDAIGVAYTATAFGAIATVLAAVPWIMALKGGKLKWTEKQLMQALIAKQGAAAASDEKSGVSVVVAQIGEKK